MYNEIVSSEPSKIGVHFTGEKISTHEQLLSKKKTANKKHNEEAKKKKKNDLSTKQNIDLPHKLHVFAAL